MKKRFIPFFLFLSFVLMLTACGSTAKDPNEGVAMDKKELEAYYPGDITKVDRIEIRNSAGDTRSFNDRKQISEWIEKIRHLIITPDPNQEDHNGFLYDVDLYEKDVQKLSFTPISIGDQPCMSNPELMKYMGDIFNS